MGAAASVQQIYREALLWYKKYFDDEMYEADFQAIDKDSDGAITYKELQRWIKSKASTEKGAWALLMNQEEVLHLAHERCAKYAATLSESTTMVPTHKVVDAHDFKRVLVHLFAISTLWIHFKNADQWVNSVDFGNFQLSLEEFKLACTTITGSYSHEVLSDEQIEQDFKRLDTNNNGSVDFMEVCDYCCTFIDPAGYATIISPPKPSPGSIKELSGLDIAAVDEVGEDEPEETSEQLATKDAFRKELHAINSLQSAHKFRSLEEKNKMAVEAIAVNLEKNQKMADFVEVKFNTENEIMQSLGTLSPM